MGNADFVVAIAAVISAVATAILAILTAILVFVGWRQLKSVREEARMNRTLQACERYETDPLLDGALRRLRSAHDNGEFAKSPSAFKADVIVLLNYLDSIAIGLKRDVYDLGVVCDHHFSIMLKHYDEYLGPTSPAIEGGTQQDDSCLVALWVEWCQRDPRVPKKRLSFW